ncbi:MAG TPA: DUF2076 domain-containing protein [Roseiarcus sp.]|nr:DUF2076 domain-containing protein [Roseiarcus sp.]
MTPEERQMLGGLFQRVNAAAATPRDAEAETFINDAVRAAPHAPYVLSQTVLVQQHALEAAANRISELEGAAQQSAGQSQEQGSFLGNLGKTIFGGGAPSALPRPSADPQAYQRTQAAPPSQAYLSPPPQGYPPPPQGYPPQPGPWSQPSHGGGFLQNAASTAAGVAGGVALGNLLGGLFAGHGGGLFGGGAGNASFLGDGNRPEMTEINNYYDDRGDRGGDDATQFDPGAPGVQDANFDNLDDSTFDGSDGSSFDDGGGYDDV